MADQVQNVEALAQTLDDSAQAGLPGRSERLQLDGVEALESVF
jgi:hypothetical protein